VSLSVASELRSTVLPSAISSVLVPAVQVRVWSSVSVSSR